MERFFRFLFVLCAVLFLGKEVQAAGSFYYPFNDTGVEIVQGWEYNFTTANHCGLDYKKASWETFEVVAAADGYYSCNTSASWGEYALGQHNIGGHTYYTIYAHLQSCDVISGEVSAGTLLGMAGDTGYANGLVHLHFEIGVDSYGQLGCSENVDPYDIYSTVDVYPENGGSCKPDYLWTECPPNLYSEPVEEEPEVEETTTYPVIMAHFEANGDNYDVTSYYNYSNALKEYGLVAEDTGKPSNLKAIYAAEVSGDSYDDLIQINTTGGHTYVYVYTAKGDGDFDDISTWKTAGTKANQAFVDDTDGDGLADLILGYKELSGQDMKWEICKSDGTTFKVCTDWREKSKTFGKSTDTFVVGDFTDSGKASILRGRETTGSSSCAGLMEWRRLKSDGTTQAVNHADGCWGDVDSQYLIGDVDSDDKDEVVEVKTRDSDVEVFVGHYAAGKLSTYQWASDVGGKSGEYHLFDIDEDGNLDLVRWTNLDSMVWMHGHGKMAAGGFDEWADVKTDAEHTLLTSLSSSGNEVVFGNFGNHIVTSPDMSAVIVDEPEDGELFKGEDEDTIYMLDGTTKRHIQTAELFVACGYSWTGYAVYSQSVVDAIADGDAWHLGECLASGTVLKGTSYDYLYYLDGSQRRHIPTATDYFACGYTWDDYVEYEQSLIDAIPQASDYGCYEPVEGDLFVGHESTEIYILSAGNKSHVSSAALYEACGYSWSDYTEISQDTVDSITTGSDWHLGNCLPTGTILKGSYYDYLYYLNASDVREHIVTAEMYLGCGFTWGDIQEYTQGLIDAVPQGSNYSCY